MANLDRPVRVIGEIHLSDEKKKRLLEIASEILGTEEITSLSVKKLSRNKVLTSWLCYIFRNHKCGCGWQNCTVDVYYNIGKSSSCWEGLFDWCQNCGTWTSHRNENARVL